MHFEPCSRSCTWFSVPDWKVLGRVRNADDGSAFVEWDAERLERIGLTEFGDEGLQELQGAEMASDAQEFGEGGEVPPGLEASGQAASTPSPSKGTSSAKQQRSGRGSSAKGKGAAPAAAATSSPQKRSAEQAVEELRDEDEQVPEAVPGQGPCDAMADK